MPGDWVDPLYRLRDHLPDGAKPMRLGAVDAVVVVTDTAPDTVDASYLPDRGVALVITDDVPPEVLAGVLRAFREHAGTLADRPTTATITLPSRDVDRCRVARECGFAPSGVLAVAAPPAVPRATTDGIVVRDAVAGDADAVAELWIEQTGYEARTGTLRTGNAIRAAIRSESQASRDGMSLVAEADGRVVGVVLTQSVESSSWATGRLTATPAAYLSVASTTSTHRGSGVGRALVGVLHERYRAAGVGASLLHYGAYNPLSVPFWSRCGYRPLLTTHAAVLR